MRRVIRTKSPKAQESSWPSNNKKEKATESRNLEEVVGGGPVARLLLPNPKTNTSGPPPPPPPSNSNIFIRKRINFLLNTLYIVLALSLYENIWNIWFSVAFNLISELPIKTVRLRMTHSRSVTRNERCEIEIFSDYQQWIQNTI